MNIKPDINKYLLIIVFLLGNQFLSYGQSKNNTSFQADTASISRNYRLAGNLLYLFPDSARKHIDTIFMLSKKRNYAEGFFRAHNLYGIRHLISNDLDQALVQFKKSLKYTEKLKTPRSKAIILGNIGLAYSKSYKQDSAVHYMNLTLEYTEEYKINDLHSKAQLDLANFYLDRGNYVKAAQSLVKARSETEVTRDSVFLIYVYSTFGLLYTKVNKFDLALQYLTKSIEINRKVMKLNHIASNYLNIGELYFNSRKNYDSALFYYRKAIDEVLPHDKWSIEQAAIINQGNVFLQRSQLDSAKKYYQTAYDDPLIYTQPNRRAAVLVNLGLYYLETKDYRKASEYLQGGYALADSLGILLYKKNALGALYRLDSIEGDFYGAFNYLKAYQNASDSLNADEANNKIAIYEFEQFLVEQKFNNDALVNENNLKSKLITNQRWFLWLSLAASFILLILIYRLFLNRRKISRLLRQLSEKNTDLLSMNKKLELGNQTLNEQQQQLKELNITKDKFFAILGHDLKGPISGFQELLGLLQEQWYQIDDTKKLEYLNILYSTSDKTHKLLQDLLSWGKAQQGLVKCQKEIISVKPAIQSVAQLFEGQIKQKELNLTIDIPDDMSLNTDPVLFSQIIQNFLNNAIKFTHRKGSISIKSNVVDSKQQICVTDSGIGIPENKLGRLFDLNADFNRPGTDKEKSSGMGLILCREFASILEAKIVVSSTEGEGSSFCLEF